MVSGVTRTVKYTYNEAGGVTALTDPWNATYGFGWNAGARGRTVTNPFSETYSIRYNPDGSGDLRIEPRRLHVMIRVCT